MKKSISEEPSNSQKRKPVSRTVTETIDWHGNKTVIDETFFDDGTSSITTTIPDVPEIVTGIYHPQTNHFAQNDQPSSLQDAEQKKKTTEAKPEIVSDIHPPQTSHFDTNDHKVRSRQDKPAPSQITSPTLSNDLDTHDENNDIEGAVNTEPPSSAQRNEYTYNETLEVQAYAVTDDRSPGEGTILATAVQIEQKKNKFSASRKQSLKPEM